MSKVVLPIHGPDHCPGGPDPIPCLRIPYFRMWQYAVQTTLDGVTGDADPLRFDRWETSDTDYFEEPSITPGTPPTIGSVNGKVRGLYIASLQLEFDATLVVGNTIGIGLEDGQGTYTSQPMVVMPAQPVGGDNSTGKYAFTFLQSYPPIWISETTAALAPATPQFRFNAALLNGDATNLTVSAMAEFHLLQAHDYETP